VRLHELVETSRRVGAASARLDKVARLADCLRGADPEEVETAVAFLSGRLRQGRIGIGPAALREAQSAAASPAPQLALLDVDRALERVARTGGARSGPERVRLLRELLGRATAPEQDFLLRLLLGELRQGAVEGLVLEAVGRAAGIPAEALRRAFLLEGDLGRVASVALRDGADGLARVSVRLFRPLRPMLAHPAQDVADAIARLGRAAFEFKLDGARIQVHKADGEVRVFTRRLHDVTAAVPEIVDAVRALPVRDLILDGEAVAFRPDGMPHPFQTTMRRFGRRLEVERMRERLPLSSLFFDCLRLDGAVLLDRPGSERFAALERALPAELRIPRTVTADPAEAERFLDRALRLGHEGLVAKSLAAAYQAGARGGEWLKLKPAHSLDLVVLAAEWGSGRRRGWLSNLHLGAREPDSGGFVMLGKTFKGMTDEMLTWQTRRLLELEVSRDAYTVYVRPELVVEVAFNDVQASPQYPAGMALRFARVKRHRPDKGPGEADTVEELRRRFEAGFRERPA
jgi:DNA ligase-1